MSADGFETELRDLLRAEAASAPVQMSIADLRARAGRRSRWSWRAWPWIARAGSVAAGLAAVTLVVAIVLNPGGRQPVVGASPSAPVPSGGPASPDPSSEASPDPSPEPSPEPSVPTFDPGPSGSLVLARVGPDGITIVSVAPDGSERVAGRIDGLDVLSSISPDARLEDNAVQAVGPAGDLLFTIKSGDGDTFTRTNVLARVGSPLTLDRIVPNGDGVFGPDGRLVIVESGTRDAAAVWVVDPARPADARQVPIPDGVAPFGGRPRLTADGTGIVAENEVVLGLDGSVRPLVRTEPLFRVTSSEQLYGADGQSFGGGCDQGPSGGRCVLLVVPAGATSPNGVNIGPNDNCCDDEAWTPAGDGVVLLTEGALWRWDGNETKRIAALPADIGHIVGFLGGDAPTAVVLDTFNETIVQPLDGGPAARHRGVLVAVVP